MIPERLNVQLGRRTASKGEAEKNTRKMWYGEDRCLELSPKRKEPFSKVAERFNELGLLNT